MVGAAPLAQNAGSKANRDHLFDHKKYGKKKIWSQFHKHYRLNDFILLGPLCDNHNFLPSKLDSAFALWKEKGITSFRDLFLNGTFVDFKSLSHEYGLPQNNFFRYL